MTKIIVFSDSHGTAANMIQAVNLYQPDLCLHLGDGENDLITLQDRFPALKIVSVPGNCDSFSPMQRKRVLEVDGKRIFMTHGDMYHVRYEENYLTIRYAALEENADIVLFGHTHQPYMDYTMGLHIMNPGSVGRGPNPTFGIIEITDQGQLFDAIQRV